MVMIHCSTRFLLNSINYKITLMYPKNWFIRNHCGIQIQSPVSPYRFTLYLSAQFSLRLHRSRGKKKVLEYHVNIQVFRATFNTMDRLQRIAVDRLMFFKTHFMCICCFSSAPIAWSAQLFIDIFSAIEAKNRFWDVIKLLSAFITVNIFIKD